MSLETANTDPAPAPEDEHAGSSPAARYLLEVDGVSVRLTFPELRNVQDITERMFDRIRMLSPGEWVSPRRGIRVTRLARARVTLEVEIEGAPADVRLLRAGPLDASASNGRFVVADGAGPLHILSAAVSKVEVDS